MTAEVPFGKVTSTVLILTPTGLGTGFVVHADKRLVVTNAHVVGSNSEVVVLFPLYDATGELITDVRKNKEAGVKGSVIDRDRPRDLALIRAERLPQKTDAVTIAARPAAVGSVVYSVGNSGLEGEGNLLWRLTMGTVRGRVERRAGETNCMILETDSAVNEGDSGGPVVNERAELVAVVSHYLVRQRQVTGNIDVEELRAFLSKLLSAP